MLSNAAMHTSNNNKFWIQNINYKTYIFNSFFEQQNTKIWVALLGINKKYFWVLKFGKKMHQFKLVFVFLSFLDLIHSPTVSICLRLNPKLPYLSIFLSVLCKMVHNIVSKLHFFDAFLLRACYRKNCALRSGKTQIEVCNFKFQVHKTTLPKYL